MSSNELRSNNLILSPAPHIHAGSSIAGTMYTIVLALMPAVGYGIWQYGWHAVRVLALSASCAMLWEFLIQKLFRREVTIGDGSALVAGLLLGLLLPPSVPWWLIVMGTFIAILVGKQIYGGLGGNPFNPTLIGWAAVRISWPHHIDFSTAMVQYDVPFSVEYPLEVIRRVGASGLPPFNGEYAWKLLLGQQVGGIGAVAGILLLAGGLFLIIRGVIRWQIPFGFCAGVALFALLFWLIDDKKLADPLHHVGFHLLTGNVLLGAFFLSTEYSSSPVNRTSMLLYGVGCGLFVMLFRVWSVYPDGVVFAILIMNILNPLLDKIRPRVPVKERKSKEEKEAA